MTRWARLSAIAPTSVILFSNHSRPTLQAVRAFAVNFGDTPESIGVDFKGIGGEVTLAASFQTDHKVGPPQTTIPLRPFAVMVRL